MTDGKCGLPRGSRKRVVADRLGAAVSSGSSAPFLVEKMRISAIYYFLPLRAQVCYACSGGPELEL